MKFLKKMKDGGPDSTVTGYWLIEWKSLFSIVLLKFEGRSRDCFHTHAFNAISWVLKGRLVERTQISEVAYTTNIYKPSLIPVITPRSRLHKVDSDGTTWVVSFRGPWSKEWTERLPDGSYQTLTHGRLIKK